MNWSQRIESIILVVIFGTVGYWFWNQQSNSSVAENPISSISANSQNETKPNFIDTKINQGQSYRVIRVSDGDTITINMNGENQSIRFACIDAPEVAHGRTPAQPMGEQSKQNLQRLIEQGGGRVSIVDTGDRTYDRIVALVFTRIGNNRVFLQEEQAKSGLAWAYTRYRSNCSNWSIVENAESAAKQRRIGLWSLGNPEAPWDFRNRMRSERGNRG